MKNTYVSYIILILISFQISFVSNSIQITLASSMEDTTTDSYQIKSNILTLLSSAFFGFKSSSSLTKVYFLGGEGLNFPIK